MSATPKQPSGIELLDYLRRKLDEARIELANPKLFQLAKATISRRIQLLEWEITSLELASNFPASGNIGQPTPHRGSDWGAWL